MTSSVSNVLWNNFFSFERIYSRLFSFFFFIQIGHYSSFVLNRQPRRNRKNFHFKSYIYFVSAEEVQYTDLLINFTLKNYKNRNFLFRIRKQMFKTYLSTFSLKLIYSLHQHCTVRNIYGFEEKIISKLCDRQIVHW